ncbi:MAG: SusF/SusE family outer membrane protein [Bacteroidetes bacterium]|nr:MAG: SusF/SusE family outer membrane protein [Bacteroidota bacterium]
MALWCENGMRNNDNALFTNTRSVMLQLKKHTKMGTLYWKKQKMKNSILLLAFGLLFNLAFAQQKDDKQLFAEFDKMLSAQYKTNETGATALVARNGRIVYRKAFGMANLELNIQMQVDNVFRIGSITKQFTAVAILQLMEQGKLNLQDSINKFFPDYPTHGHKITIEHLLTHTSGIQSYTGIKDFEKKMTLDLRPTEMIDFFKNEPMEFAPGTKWNYNNSGYFLLGYIIEKVSGKTYPQYIEENFFKPLGTGFINAPYLNMNQPYSAGSIQSTVEDLFKWHQAVHGYKLVKKQSLDKAFTKYKLTDGKETEYGYGWSLGDIQGSPTIGHNGGIPGFLTQSVYLPKEDVFVAVFSNCGCNPPFEIADKMATLAIGKTIAMPKWGIIGTSTPNNWDADQPMTYDAASKTWKITLNLKAGEFKFRANGTWNINLGDTNGDGALKRDGDNLKLAANGNYTVSLMMNDAGHYTYTLIKN